MTRRGSDLTVTDLFCGAGGSSQGVIKAGGRVVFAGNHWDRAIETYGANLGHQVRIVDRVDISACDPRRYPSTRIAVMSPECTTHSPAGGNRRKQKEQGDLFTARANDPAFVRSRVTMWDVVRFTEYHEYDVVITENVIEAATRWVLFPEWLRTMDALGYHHRIVSLNSMFCWPTPQSRDRMYVVFWKKGNRAPDLDIRKLAPCARCGDVAARQTFKNGRTLGKHKTQYVYACPTCHATVTPYYYAALNAIDLSIAGTRIGDRPRPLEETTLTRIRYGLDKYGDRMLVVNMKQRERDSSRAWPADLRPVGTVPTWDNYFGLASPFTIETSHTDSPNRRPRELVEPVQAMTAQLSAALVSPAFLLNMRGTDPSHLRNSAIALDGAVPTQTAEGNHGFVITAGSNETAPSALDAPIGAQTGTHRFAVVTGGATISLRAKGGERVGSMAEELLTQTGAHQSALISVAPFLTTYYGNGGVAAMDDAVPTMTTHDRVNVVSPRQALRVEDCYFRMFVVPEIQRTMAFADDYIVTGTKREQVKQLGNAVTPPAMEDLYRRCAASLEPEVEYDAA
jgi:DNA (cytosine-5)-methyltransferase 1